MESRNMSSPANVAGIVMTILIFLLPVKFGGLAVMPESPGFYPLLWTDWIFVAFPPHALGIVGAYMLLWALFTGIQIPRKQGQSTVGTGAEIYALVIHEVAHRENHQPAVLQERHASGIRSREQRPALGFAELQVFVRAY